MSIKLVADGGEITVGARVAVYTYGAFNVVLPEGRELDTDDYTDDGYTNGYVYRPKGTDQLGRFDIAFARADVTIETNAGYSNFEAIVDASQRKVSEDVYFERDITGAGLGPWTPGEDYEVGDVVDVLVFNRVIPQPVTAITYTSASEDPLGVRVHVGGQTIRDAELVEEQNRSVREAIAQESAQRRKQVGAVQSTATAAKNTADEAFAAATDADGVIAGKVRDATEASKRAREFTDKASGHSDRARKHSEASLGHAEDAQREAQKARLASAKSSEASQASVAASRASGAASASSFSFSAIAHDWSEESHKWSAESWEFSKQARVHTDAASGHSDRARKYSLAAGESAIAAAADAAAAETASQASSVASQASVDASEESGKASKASQKASREATASKQVSVDAMQKAERYRNEAESARDDAERKRAEAEAKRDEAETFRRGSFASMSASHAAWSMAEMERMEAEDARAEAERFRGEAEDRRAAAERFRDQAERKRDEAERHRQAAAEARDETLSIHQWSSNQQMDVHSNMVWWAREQRTRVYSHDASHGRKTHEGGLLTTWDYQAKRGLSFSAQGDWWGKVAFTVEYKAVTGGGSAVDLWTFNVGPGQRSDNFERGAIGMQFSHAHIVVEVWKPNNAVWYIPVDTATGKIADVSMYDTPAGNPFSITSTGALEVRGIGARLDNIIRPDPNKNIFTPAQVTIPGTKRRVWPAYIKVTET